MRPQSPLVPGTTRGTLLLITAGGAVGFAAIAVLQGYSVDWDVLNYHYYNGYAFLHARTWQNLQVGMRQSYFFPLLDAGFALLVNHLPATLVAIVLAAVQSLALPLLFLIARETCYRAEDENGKRRWVAGLLALLGVAAPGNILELGGPSGDTLVALPLLAGLLAMLRGRAVWAGALAGAAAALKLTAAPFALGLLAAIIAHAFIARPWRAASGTGATACAAALAIFLALYGPWAVALSVHFGNPFFPSLNDIFHSSWAAPMSYVDPAFALRGWRDALLFPYSRLSLFGKPDFTGPFYLRFGIIVPLALLAVARRLVTRRATIAAIPLLVFVVVGYAAWLGVFAVNRYAVVLEFLAPIATACAFRCLTANLHLARWLTAASCALMLWSASRTVPTYWIPWLHAHADGRGYFGLDLALPASLEKGGTVAVLSLYPAAFLIPFFPTAVDFVRLQGSLYFDAPSYVQMLYFPAPVARRAVFGNAMGHAICARLHAGANPLYALRAAEGYDRTDAQALAYYGIQVSAHDCAKLHARSPFMQFELCPATRMPDPECR